MNILARDVGRRKEAVAQVQLVKTSTDTPGGQFIINDQPLENYLHNNTCSILSVKSPLSILNSMENVRSSSVTHQNTNMDLNEESSEINTSTSDNIDSSIVSNYRGETFNIIVKVKGGGLVGQAEAIKLGLSRALCTLVQTPVKSELSTETILRKEFKDKGYLTQDSRVKERRKYGLKKARKASQYHKR